MIDDPGRDSKVIPLGKLGGRIIVDRVVDNDRTALCCCKDIKRSSN